MYLYLILKLYMVYLKVVEDYCYKLNIREGGLKCIFILFCLKLLLFCSENFFINFVGVV